MIILSPQDISDLAHAMAAAIGDNAERLTALDQAIGDGDHGLNMTRGFDAVLADIDAISAKPLPEALKAAGMKLVMTVGGASGPLVGTFFMTLGKELPQEFDRESFSRAFEASIQAVAARGKSQKGQKTLLDVLYPVHEALEKGVEIGALTDIADKAAEATIPVLATRGRASFLGERSIGHMDPGSASVALLTGVVCQWALKKA